MTSIEGLDAQRERGDPGQPAGSEAQEVPPRRRCLGVEGVAMGGEELLRSSSNPGFRTGNLLAEPGPGQGWESGLVAQCARGPTLVPGEVELMLGGG